MLNLILKISRKGVVVFTWITHVSVPFAIYMLLTRHTDIRFNLIVAIIIVFYSLLPDLDHPNSKIVRIFPPLAIISIPINIIAGHRGIIHSLFFSFIFTGPLLLLENKIYFIAAFLAYNSHLLLDMLTKTPIPVFYPFKRTVSLKLLSTNSPEEYIIALICIWIILL